MVSESPWQGHHEDVAGSDTEPVVPGHPSRQPAPLGRDRDPGLHRDSSAWHHLPVLAHVPRCYPGAGAGVLQPRDNPSGGTCCATCPAGTGGATELRCCTAPLPPQSHPHPCPHPPWVSRPQDGQHLEVCAVVPELEPTQHQGPGLSSCWQNLGHAMSPGVAPAPCPQTGDPHPAQRWGRAAAGEPH